MDITSNVNKSLSESKEMQYDLFFVENERESRLYPMNSHKFSLVLLNIIAANISFGLETIEFSHVLFLSCMSNQASSVRLIYLPPLKYRNFSIFMIEVCKKTKVVHLSCLYSPFHSSLPFQHLGQSSFCVNQVTFLFYFRAETVSQVPGVLKIHSTFIFS